MNERRPPTWPRHVEIPATRKNATAAYEDEHGRLKYFVECLVEEDGDVFTWDKIGGHYIRARSLSAEELILARKKARDMDRLRI